MNRQQLLEAAKAATSQHPATYGRAWRAVNQHSNYHDDNSKFRVMQWNLLADSLCAKGGDKGFERAPSESLNWEFRKNRILEHILHVEPDILCVEELDESHYSQWLRPAMESVGFVAVFVKKPDESSRDGSALFTNSSRFAIENWRGIRYEIELEDASQQQQVQLVAQNQTAIIAQLVSVSQQNEQRIAVAVTHLKAEKSARGELVRELEVDALLNALNQEYGSTRIPIVIAADLNATPTGTEYPSLAQPLILKHALGMRSAYDTDGNGGPEYTTWKVRKGKESRHVIDYVFYRAGCGLDVTGVLDLPIHVEEERVPSFRYPSDHFALAVEFKFV